jgi:hypothetical protein
VHRSGRLAGAGCPQIRFALWCVIAEPGRVGRMSRPALVPSELRDSPFRGHVAVERGLLTPRQLQGSAWRRLLRDVYVHRDVVDDEALRAAALALVTDGRLVACGRTAAWLHGVWNPPPGAVVPLETTAALEGSGRGLSGHPRRRLTLRETVGDPEVVEVRGIPVLSARRTCFDLMRERRLVEAVVVADAFAAKGLLDVPWFYAYVDYHRRWPGVDRVRKALTFASADALSPGETRLRMVVVLAGFPEPWVNPPVWGGDPSELLGYPDLLLMDVPQPTALEYDGADHALPAQYRHDLRRENRFLTRVSFTSCATTEPPCWSVGRSSLTTWPGPPGTRESG